jgi:hypothetical protein
MGIAIMVCLMLAAWCAEYDAGRIIMGKPIHHRRGGMSRASVRGITCIGREVPGMAIGCAGLFSAAFRSELNAARGLTWYYISDSNWYDAAWIKLAGSAKAGGILAYCAEGIVFVSVLTWYLMR